jgi:hypothetical protein
MTWIWGLTGAPDGVWPAAIMPVKRLPSRVMSCGQAAAPPQYSPGILAAPAQDC